MAGSSATESIVSGMSDISDNSEQAITSVKRVVEAFRGVNEASDSNGYWSSDYDEAKWYAEYGENVKELYKGKIKFDKAYYTDNLGRDNNNVRYLGAGFDDISK
jgi:hypothetical protein